jgi:hypothetical protein
MMNLEFAIKQMADHAEMIRSLAEGVSQEQACWKPDPETWSILEVIHHLYDEEWEDFRVRLELILKQSNEPWPPLDNDTSVSERAYNQHILSESLQSFLDERLKTITWLHGLGSPNWQIAAQAPWGGMVTAGDMLAAWVAHDLLHMRQLVELHWAYTTKELAPYSVEYAGGW